MRGITALGMVTVFLILLGCASLSSADDAIKGDKLTGGGWFYSEVQNLTFHLSVNALVNGKGTVVGSIQLTQDRGASDSDASDSIEMAHLNVTRFCVNPGVPDQAVVIAEGTSNIRIQHEVPESFTGGAEPLSTKILAGRDHFVVIVDDANPDTIRVITFCNTDDGHDCSAVPIDFRFSGNSLCAGSGTGVEQINGDFLVHVAQ